MRTNWKPVVDQLIKQRLREIRGVSAIYELYRHVANGGRIEVVFDTATASVIARKVKKL